MTVDYEKAGMPLDRPGVRIARLAESIAILKGLFADGPFSFEGEHYRVTELDGQPKPVQRPHPPFVIGGGGKKVLALAAREAQIVGVNANLRSGDGSSADAASSLTSERTDEKIQWLRDAAGKNFDDLEIQTLVGFVHFTDDRTRIAEAMAASFGVTPDDAILAPVTLVGYRVADRRPARDPPRTLAHELHGRSPRIHDPTRADRLPAGRDLRRRNP